MKLHSRDIPTNDLQSFNTVIFLGGLTGRAACNAHTHEEVWRENVEAPADVAKRMKGNQVLFFASTSAVTEGSGEEVRRESDAVDKNLLDSYSMSMFAREANMTQFAERAPSPPKLVAFRFGTVIGVSPGQRTDLLHMALLASSFTTGVLGVFHPKSSRAFLWLEDLARAFQTAIDRHATLQPGLSLFHLASFNTNVQSVANAVAARTQARIEVRGLGKDDADKGFSLDTSKFKDTFSFKFQGSQEAVINNLYYHIPASITAKGAHVKNSSVSATGDGRTPCPVCGACHHQEVLDLGEQPFANDFRATEHEALNAPTSALKLLRCRSCNHMFLSEIADRKELFSNYLYQSGTSATLKQYFGWLADKVVSESSAVSDGNILEIASNDGSQLDKFKERGWKTFGVDPAENIAPIAREKGHTIAIGFWGEGTFSNMLGSVSLDAIVAQNVFAHVPQPVKFLNACKAVMGPSTKLYIQTSQCHMLQDGEFDTAYHEHISFFSGHSFQKAADMAGLRIAAFELTPIHGTSCLVTLQKQGSVVVSHGVTLRQRIEEEEGDGISQDFFYERYKERAFQTRRWINRQMQGLIKRGYEVGAYGAAAKGMVLLHFLLREASEASRSWKLGFVLDDAPLKQGMFCPGTRIPTWPTAQLASVDERKPLAILVLAWNFWPEIAKSIRGLGLRRREVLCLLPFPQARLVRLDLTPDANRESELSRIPFYPHAWPARKQRQRKLMLLTHFFNEEMLLPFFIQHHAPSFDHAVLIDFDSTDRSVELIKRLAPPSWRVVRSTTGRVFDARKTDQQIMDWEAQFPEDWHIALTVTEFLVHPTLRSFLQNYNPPPGLTRIVKFRSAEMVGDDTHPLQYGGSLPKQRSVYQSGNVCGLYCRFAHAGFKAKEYSYVPGRHGMQNNKQQTPEVASEGVILKYKWTPWPESIKRKQQEGANIPQSDAAQGFGTDHIVHNKDHGALLKEREDNFRKPQTDLRQVTGLHQGEKVDPRHVSFQEALDPVPLF